MEKAGERVRALQGFPELLSTPAVLIFRLVNWLGNVGDFRCSGKLLANRFFLGEEGGPNVREIYVALRLKRAKSTATPAECPCGLYIIRHLTAIVALRMCSKGISKNTLGYSFCENRRELGTRLPI